MLKTKVTGAQLFAAGWGATLMEWSKLFASLPGNPRVQAAEEDGRAFGLLAESMCYCTSAETGGFVRDSQVRRFLTYRSAGVTALAREELWIRDDGRRGYLLDPEIWNEDRNLSDSAEKKRQADRGRIAARRAATKAARNGDESRDVSRDSSATGGATSSGDSRTVEKRREEKRRTDLSVVDVGDQSADRNARTRKDDLIVERITQAIYDTTSHVIDALWAGRIRDHIASMAADGNLGPAYFEKAIRSEQDPAKRFLEHDPPPSWCGQCSPYRHLEDSDTGDDLGRCPECHPSLRKEAS